jgi:hypothetical protein
MRPLVVGPSPVITPSRTIVRASAAVSRQEIRVSMVASGSANLATEADIGTLLIFLISGAAFPCGRKRVVNDSKLAAGLFSMVADWSL